MDGGARLHVLQKQKRASGWSLFLWWAGLVLGTFVTSLSLWRGCRALVDTESTVTLVRPDIVPGWTE